MKVFILIRLDMEGQKLHVVDAHPSGFESPEDAKQAAKDEWYDLEGDQFPDGMPELVWVEGNGELVAKSAPDDSDTFVWILRSVELG